MPLFTDEELKAPVFIKIVKVPPGNPGQYILD